MRKPIDQMTISDWLDAGRLYNDSTLSRMKSVGKKAGLNVPKNFQLYIESETANAVAKEARQADTKARSAYNKAVELWSEKTTILLRSSVSAMVTNDNGSSDSVRPLVYYPRGEKKEANRVGFTFARHLAYLHKGAGRGQGGDTGSSWTDKYGKLKKTNRDSFGKQDTGNRLAKKWFDPVIRKQLPELADIVAEYSADLVVNSARIFVDKK